MERLLPLLAVPEPEPTARMDPLGWFPEAVTDVWLEIGFGSGEHLAGQAGRRRDVGFIGCEPYLGGVSALLSAIAGQSLTNVRIGTGDARLLLPHLEDGCLGRVFVLFADPWPKRRHHRRRLISRPTLDMIARVLREGGELRFASDSRDYVAWTLERVSNHPAFAWTARRPGDWRVPPTDWVPTRYEIKAQQRGETCTYLSFRRHPGRPDAAGE